MSLAATTLLWLETWGEAMRSTVERFMKQSFREYQETELTTVIPQDLQVGTDCSGAEAPIYALRAMKIKHTQAFASDSSGPVRDFIQANSPNLHVYEDILHRNNAETKHVDLYVAGFPCKPWSRLHSKSRQWDEPQAKVFWGNMRFLKANKPAVAVFENVLGVKRGFSKILPAIRKHGYLVMSLEMNPAQLAEPVQRPRVYLLCIRQDVAIASQEALQSIFSRAWELIRDASPSQFPKLHTRVLPTSHPAVQSYTQRRKQALRQTSTSGHTTRVQKWQRLHTTWKRRHLAAVKATHSALPTADDLLLTNLRVLMLHFIYVVSCLSYLDCLKPFFFSNTGT